MSPKGTACPGCGKVRQTRNGKICYCADCIRGTGALPGGSTAWMLAEAAKQRAAEAAITEAQLEAATEAYKRVRAVRHPWLTIGEAAAELGVQEPRISTLIAEGVLRTKPGVKSRRVAAADVYAYKPRNIKRRNAA